MEEFEVRGYKSGDDIEKIAKLVYGTDPYIYPCMFENMADCKNVMANMITDERTPYATKNLTVMTQGDEIVGLVVSFRTPTEIDLDAMKQAFINADVKITDNVQKVLNEYYKPLENEKLNNIYILNVCIDQQKRGQGLGKKMMDGFLKDDESYELVTLKDNPAAVKLYESCGFEVYDEGKGFDGKEAERPDIVMMHRGVTK